MNFLAHLHLAEPTPASRMGSLLGDFVRGYPWDERYPEAVWKGIVEHRHVDAFTDSHPSWQKSREILPSEMRRFAGIVIDIFYDFFLHRYWENFSHGEPLDHFISSVHSQLEAVADVAPPEAAEAIASMIRQGWLKEYATLEGIDLTLRRVSFRSPILEPIFDAAEILQENLEVIESHFLEFYPELQAYMPQLRAEIDAERAGRL
ncbi:MAG: ACP phosphodiesterase [Verrucomicrobiales bacterium]|nr:ACP phosphodiesterase [Verrucomicrobiales bacterium]